MQSTCPANHTERDNLLQNTPHRPQLSHAAVLVRRLQKFGTSILLLAGAMITSPLWARDYEVELMIFERINPPGEVEEQWNSGANSQLLNMETLIDLVGRADIAIETAPTEGETPDEIIVEAEVSRMQRLQSGLMNSGYRILYRARWQQPPAVFQDAPVLRVGEAETRLQGAIRVYRTSLIFADVSLGLGDFLKDSEAPIYFINEKRRLKFKEIHYFDHPRFGALITVWPVDSAEE